MSEKPSEQKPPYLVQQEVIVDVQEHLMQISKLTGAVAEALANGNENFAAELDKQVDLEFAKKERAMGRYISTAKSTAVNRAGYPDRAAATPEVFAKPVGKRAPSCGFVGKNPNPFQIRTATQSKGR